ncbi:hypothetical protein HY572_05215 [Candidatus Micrarchaeota archaeon]|nr:hypothetical protein [Candidatus Micrarchaeota archaeon]
MERRLFTARNFAQEVAQEVREQGLSAHVVGNEETGVFVHVPVNDEKVTEHEIQMRLGHAVHAIQSAHENAFSRHRKAIRHLSSTGQSLRQMLGVCPVRTEDTPTYHRSASIGYILAGKDNPDGTMILTQLRREI